ncbi:hypothetical protein CMI37_32065 [Candidatus Pacearchaeota archaeon]|nr:hypothetical protein [Candidatus Pacearchaeota archaeon]|tara:strand:- start:2109 stop:2366 length:258 start_codon:yes stop_codon:yes gene_type:complete
MKNGIHTSEFWLTLISIVCGGVLSSGLITSEVTLQILGTVGSILAGLGYVGARAWTKGKQELGRSIVAAARIQDAIQPVGTAVKK